MSAVSATAPIDRSLLQVRSLHKNFGGVKAVSDISFDVPGGAIFAVIGPNGAGKSTLLNLISGVYQPDTGSLSFQNKALSAMPAHRRVRLGIARTFQKGFPSLQAVERPGKRDRRISCPPPHPDWQYVTHGAAFAADQRRCRERATQLLQFVGMSGRLHALAGWLVVNSECSSSRVHSRQNLSSY